MDTDLNGVRLFVFAFIIILLSIFCGVLMVDRVKMEQKVIILECNVSKLESNVSDMKDEFQVIRDTRLIDVPSAKSEKTSK